MFKCRPTFFGCSPATTATAIPTKTTSLYVTHLGEISLTWRRCLFGLSLVVDNRLFPSRKGESHFAGEQIHFCISLFLPFSWKGSKQILLKTAGGRSRAVEVFWDLSKVTFSGRWGPKPAAGFFVAVLIGGEVLLVEGDLREEAFRRMGSMRPRNGEIVTEPVSRRVNLKFRKIGRKITWMEIVRLRGREREVLMSIDLKKMRLRLVVDGVTVFQLKRLWWKFRGNERVVGEGGDRIRVSWDLHKFLFWAEPGVEASLEATKTGDAVFILQFENGEEGESRKGMGVWPNFWKKEDWSESSSCSTSTASSSLSVVDWESPEDVELRNSDAGGFTLVICGRKS